MIGAGFWRVGFMDHGARVENVVLLTGALKQLI